VMAHVNTTGRHIPIYLDSPSVLGLGRSNTYPMQEGAFFGNIFISPPQAYYCNGFDWDRGPVSGRIGANVSGSPYKDPYSGAGLCKSNCATVGYNGEAYASCAANGVNFGNNVVTVFRDFDPNVPYTICNPITNNCIAIKGNSTSAGGIVDVWPLNSASQKFYFERVNVNSHDGNYRIRSNNSGLYVDVTNGSTAAGGTMTQQYGNGQTNQAFNMIQIASNTYLIENERSRLLLNARGIAPGAPLVQSGSGYYDDYQVWKLTLAQ